MTQATYNPMMLADVNFAKEFSVLFDRYIDLRCNGMPADMAVIDAFDLIQNGLSLDNVHQLGLACDVNDYVREGMKRKLSSVDIRNDLWPKHRAVHALLKLIEDPNERGTTRLNAINALNAFCGYVEICDVTRRRTHSLQDFYRLTAEAFAREQDGNEGQARH